MGSKQSIYPNKQYKRPAIILQTVWCPLHFFGKELAGGNIPTVFKNCFYIMVGSPVKAFLVGRPAMHSSKASARPSTMPMIFSTCDNAE